MRSTDENIVLGTIKRTNCVDAAPGTNRQKFSESFYDNSRGFLVHYIRNT